MSNKGQGSRNLHLLLLSTSILSWRMKFCNFSEPSSKLSKLSRPPSSLKLFRNYKHSLIWFLAEKNNDRLTDCNLQTPISGVWFHWFYHPKNISTEAILIHIQSLLEKNALPISSSWNGKTLKIQNDTKIVLNESLIM